MELFVAWRFLLARRGGRFLAAIPFFSVLGIVIGVAVLTVVLSVMNGFEDEIRARVLGIVSHATIEGIDGELQDWQAVSKRAERDPRVLATAPYVEREALLRGARNSGASIRGVDPALEPRVSDVGARLSAGSLDDLAPGRFGIVLGKRLAESLGAKVGDPITAFVAAGTDDAPFGAAYAKSFHVVGLLDAGMEEYDAHLALVNVRDAEALFRLGAPSGLRLRLDDALAAYPVGRDLAQAFGRAYRVADWTRGYRNLFESIVTQKRVMLLILSLIVAVAAFNLVGTLVMQVVDKQGDIAILRTLGSAPRSIMAVFVAQGAAIGTVGIALGVALGTLLAVSLGPLVSWLERHLDFLVLAPGVYPVDEVVSRVRADDVAWIVSIAFATCLVATIYPALRASRSSPADALRFE